MKSAVDRLERSKELQRAAVRPPKEAYVFVPPQRKLNEPDLRWFGCEHRGNQTRLFNAREYNCGCGEVVFHECLKFGEEVMTSASNRVIKNMVARVEGYQGRTCRNCELWKETK